MPSSYTLGAHFESFIQAQLASGRYNNASEVVRDALRLMEARERQLAVLDARLAVGIADGEAGRVRDMDEVFDTRPDSDCRHHPRGKGLQGDSLPKPVVEALSPRASLNTVCGRRGPDGAAPRLDC